MCDERQFDFDQDELAYLQIALNLAEEPLAPDLLKSAAIEVLTYRTFEPASDVALRRGVILTRAASRLQAKNARPMGVIGGVIGDVSGASSSPTEFRKGSHAKDITVSSCQFPYSKFFAVGDVELSHSRFDGTRSDALQRAVFMMADAVTVLPYDPKRDRVLIIEQFRSGPYLRGDQKPWMIEPIAGRIDVGETAAQTAHREAAEEANLQLKELHLAAEYYPSPGAITEYISAFIAIADLPDEAAGIGGLAQEDEDISSILLSFEELMQLADQGALDTGPLFISALWLARHKSKFQGS